MDLIAQTDVSDPILTQVGIGGVLAVLILREVFGFLSKRSKREVDLAALDQRVSDLWDWHNKEDPATGVKVWYVRASLENAIEKLAENIEKMTEVKL